MHELIDMWGLLRPICFDDGEEGLHRHTHLCDDREADSESGQRYPIQVEARYVHDSCLLFQIRSYMSRVLGVIYQGAGTRA